MFVTLFGGQRPVWVNGDQARAAALRFLGSSPEVQTGCDRITSPDQDQAAFLKKFEMHPNAAAIGIFEPGDAGAGAHGPLQPRSTQRMKEPPCHAFALNQPHRSAIAVRQDGLRRTPSNLTQLGGRMAQRFGPRNRFEPSFAFTADPLERGRQAVRVIHALGIARHLRAQHALRRRMFWIALNLDGPAVFHLDLQCAGVRTIVRADALYQFVGRSHAEAVSKSGGRRRNLCRSSDCITPI